MKTENKYMVIRNYIKSQIISGKLQIGDQIPTEKQLAEKFEVSRITVNKAILQLVNDGYVERIAGKGSFIINKHVTKHLGATTSFTKDMASIGLIAGSKLIDFRMLSAEDVPEIASCLDLSHSDTIYYFIRLRTGNGTPIALSYTYVNAKAIPSFDINSLNGSFYEYLQSLGLKIKGTIGEMSAVLPTEEQKRLLRINNIALLKNTHTTYLIDDTPFEHIDTYYIGTRYSYKFKSFPD